MKNRNVIRMMCVLLLVLLLCALGPAAWADEGSGAQQTPDAPEVSREQMLLDYMACVMAADKAQTQAEQEQMLRTAEELWQNYSDTLRGQWVAAEPEPAPAEAEAVQAVTDAPAQIEDMRTELLTYYMLYRDAAYAERDPYIRAALYDEANAIWDAYMSLLIEEPAPQPAVAEPVIEQPVVAKPVIEQPAVAEPVIEQPAAVQSASADKLEAIRTELLTYYLLCVDAAYAEQDPYVREALYEDADEIWEAYMYLVRSEDEIKAAAASPVTEAPAAVEPAAVEPAAVEPAPAEPAAAEPLAAQEIAALRAELLTYYLLYMDAAEAEQDPYVCEALYEDASDIWDAYMALLFSDGMVSDAAAEDIYLDSYVCDDPYLTDMYGQEMIDWTETHSHGGHGHHHMPADTMPELIPDEESEDLYPGYDLPAAEDKPLIGLPNPWTVTDSLEEAVRISGIALDPPAAEALPKNMQLQCFRAMDGTIEADYADGEDELTIRASRKNEGYALAGDYNKYSTEWKENIKGLSVRCLGNGERINVAVFGRGALAFSLTANPGREGTGLTAGELKSIVLGMQAKPFAGDEAQDSPAAAPESDEQIVVHYNFTHSDENGTVEQSGTFTLPTEPTAAAPVQEILEPAEAAAPAETAAPAEAAAPAEEKDDSAVVTGTDYSLVIHDPFAVDADGKPVRLVRIGETNLGDLCADALRAQANADIGIIDSGAICADLGMGDITDAGIRAALPYEDNLCLIAASGQQILDALEWGSRAVPYEFGGFLQVSGLSYEIHSYLESGCVADENEQFAGVEGERRVKNVTVNGEALNPERVYLVAGPDFLLLNSGAGNTAFQGAIVLRDQIKPVTQALIDYLIDNLGGVIGEQYADPYGVGRIVVYEVAPTEAGQAPAAAEPDAPVQHHTDVKKAANTARHPKIMIKAH